MSARGTTQRQLQASVDAAALAGAQAMPDDPGAAVTLANQYLDKNGDAAARSVGLKSVESANDSVSVSATRHAPGFFSEVLGIESVTVSAKASATGGVNPSEVTGVAPIAVDEKHPMLECKPLPCFNEATTLDLKKTGPGAFRLVNVDGSHGGTGPRSCRTGHGIQGQTGGSSIDFGVRSVSRSE
jgi:hypothetical protein